MTLADMGDAAYINTLRDRLTGISDRYEENGVTYSVSFGPSVDAEGNAGANDPADAFHQIALAVVVAVGHHGAPGRRRRRDADAEVAEDGLG